MKNVYKYWDRKTLWAVLKEQADEYNYNSLQLYSIIFDDRWDPVKDYNGCNFIQDKYHPFIPCLVHDFNWVVFGGSAKVDKEFKNDLIKFGYSKFNANLFYLSVRLGWVLYFKWKK